MTTPYPESGYVQFNWTTCAVSPCSLNSGGGGVYNIDSTSLYRLAESYWYDGGASGYVVGVGSGSATAATFYPAGHTKRPVAGVATAPASGVPSLVKGSGVSAGWIASLGEPGVFSGWWSYQNASLQWVTKATTTHIKVTATGTGGAGDTITARIVPDTACPGTSCSWYGALYDRAALVIRSGNSTLTSLQMTAPDTDYSYVVPAGKVATHATINNGTNPVYRSSWYPPGSPQLG